MTSAFSCVRFREIVFYKIQTDITRKETAMAYKDKYFSILGDSISTYEGYLPDGYPAFYSRRNAFITGINGYFDTWWGQLLKHFGAELLVNNSWSGSYVCKPRGCEIESYGCSNERTFGLHRDGIYPDVILVYIGTNDRGACFKLTDSDKSDLNVIENAYGVMLDKLKINYPNAEIWCCTFPITSCLRNPYFCFPVLQEGVPMTEYGELIKRVAIDKNCRTIDLWDEALTCDTIDGLHPNLQGMNRIAQKAIKAMEENETE